jgi:hypothetical protein
MFLLFLIFVSQIFSQDIKEIKVLLGKKFEISIEDEGHLGFFVY